MIKEFKFFQKKKLISTRQVFVDYTTDYNGKSFTSLKFSDSYQTQNNPDVEIYRGTFLGFKRMVELHNTLDWNTNKPIIHLIAFYSKRFNNCQRLGYIDFFRQRRYRFGKNQKIKIYYEAI